MVKVMFVCLGNICRSPMGEFILKDIVGSRGIADRFYISSSATSRDEVGNPVYPPARKILREHGISCEGKRAVQFAASDYEKYDYILAADGGNVRALSRMTGGDPDKKVYRLLDFTDRPRDIADPWYTGDFTLAYGEIVEGCEAFLSFLAERDLI